VEMRRAAKDAAQAVARGGWCRRPGYGRCWRGSYGGVDYVTTKMPSSPNVTGMVAGVFGELRNLPSSTIASRQQVVVKVS
jgi:hypothetical protein